MNWKSVIERMIVTFVETSLTFLSLNRWDFGNKTVLAGAVGAGLSAVYNLWKQSRAK